MGAKKTGRKIRTGRKALQKMHKVGLYKVVIAGNTSVVSVDKCCRLMHQDFETLGVQCAYPVSYRSVEKVIKYHPYKMDNKGLFIETYKHTRRPYVSPNRNFSVLQLFTIIDGRVSTDLEDVYRMLSIYGRRSILTHEIPPIFEYLMSYRPSWYSLAYSIIRKVKLECSNDFEEIIACLKREYGKVRIKIKPIDTQRK
jgi:hypothetical protein